MTDSPWLVIGLGNPGPEYKNTRHNVGAMVIDQVISDLGEKLTHNKKVTSDVCETRLGTKRVVLATLRCYMNESGGPTASLAGAGCRVIVTEIDPICAFCKCCILRCR